MATFRCSSELRGAIVATMGAHNVDNAQPLENTALN